MSSIRETAEKIVRETILVVPGKIADRYIAAIEQALRDEREQCAKIAEKSHPQPCTCTTCLVHAEIAAAIRKRTEANAK